MKKITIFLRDHLIKSKSLHGTRLVALSFAAIILLGTLLLSLPVATQSGESIGFLTALFTATSATCVTGLVLVDTALTWSIFGQVVILVMIQLGGLGFMTVLTLISMALGRRISLSERLVIASTFNLNGVDGVVRVVRYALLGTFLMEAIGTLFFATQFVPQFGLVQGLWTSLFHAISAFCNAGFDLMGPTYGAFSSLAGYVGNPVVLLTTCMLVVVGGLGFFVWEDIVRNRSIKKISLYSKMVIYTTAVLLVAGALFFFWEETATGGSMGDMPLWQQVLNAFFQSTTLRTAGFDVVGQGNLTESSQMVSVIFMLVGGSSGSTAGGLKTGTLLVLLLALRANLRGQDQVTLRGRAIPYRQVINAMTLVLVVMMLTLVGSLVLATVESTPFVAALFEVASAMGTVGLSTGITPHLSFFSQILIIVLMYLGRVGILSFSLVFMTSGRRSAKIKYPETNVMVG